MKRLVIKGIFSFALILTSLVSVAQAEVEMADRMRADGKIYVVVAIILIVLTGLIGYLALLDRKVKKLEDLLADKDRSNK